MNELPSLVQHDFIFSEERILNCAGVVPGDNVYTHERDMCARRRTAKLIQQIGIASRCTQLVMNTAIIMMHRLFMYWPSYKLPLGKVAAACFFLAAKIEDTPRRLNFVVQQYFRFERGVTDLRQLSKDEITSVSDEIVLLESLMLPCLGFTLKITQPHQILIRGCRDLNLPKMLWQTAYYNCTNLLHLTIMVLRLRPETLAAACVQMAASWSNDTLPPPTDAGKHWFNFFDVNMTQENLKMAVDECIREFTKVPSAAKETVQELARLTPTQNQVNQMSQRAQQRRQQEKEAAASAAAAAAASTAAGGAAVAPNNMAPGAPVGAADAAAAATAAATSQKQGLTIDEYKRRRQADSTSSAPTTPGSVASAAPATSASASAATTAIASTPAGPPVPPAAAPASSKTSHHHHPQHHPHHQQQHHLSAQHHQQKPHHPPWLPHHHNPSGKQPQHQHGPPSSTASAKQHHHPHHQHHHHASGRPGPPNSTIPPHVVGSSGAKRPHLMMTSGDNVGAAAAAAGPGGSGDPSQLKRYKPSSISIHPSASAPTASGTAPTAAAASTVPSAATAGHYYNTTTAKQHQ